VLSASRRASAWRLAALVLLLAAPGALAAGAQPAPRGPDDAEVARAIQQVKNDPNLATERTIKTLQWKDSGAPPSTRPAWLDWVLGFFRWLDQSARVLVWAAVAVLAGMLAFYIVRTVRAWDTTVTAGTFEMPTHVQDLDIRPESLPPNIGAAARELWDGGEHRAALALLYRGLLSRLAHVHQLPVRDSSTEGDCLALCARIGGLEHQYAAGLIGLWQAAVYGRLEADTSAVYALCDGFAPALDGRVPGGEA
jgi:hypothetical protein